MAADDSRDRLDRVVSRAHAERDQRERSYRAQALKLYPWVCGRCAREFSRQNLQELTVHHRDHNHDNNPPDGSNWELLCVYCHDDEHSRYVNKGYGDSKSDSADTTATYNPFAELAEMLARKK